MRVTMTGATGLIGPKLVRELLARGDEVTVLQPLAGEGARRARRRRGGRLDDPTAEPAPAAALDGRDAVVHLAGEPVAQRWSDDVKRRIRARASRAPATSSPGWAAGDPPRALVSSSAVGYYGPHGDERLDEQAAAGDDFLAEVCVAWEREAQAAALGPRRPRPHRHRPRPGRRRAGDDAAVLQGRRRRPGRRRQAVHAVDRTSTTSSGSTSRRSTTTLVGPGQRHRPRARHQQGVLQDARQGAQAPGVRARAQASRSRRSTARWPRSWSRARAGPGPDARARLRVPAHRPRAALRAALGKVSFRDI